MDLVEISPNAEPPVCRIMNYGKFIYEKEKAAKEQKKNKKLFKLKRSNSVRELMMAIIKLNFVALSVS
ncbi:translation initiation factor IF-3 [Mannheimia haemolytica]|nr:translation initiation factor IF-3 [Mannheimia haemolytica]KYL11734.1 translation initiation factor IF-3 [Mannheimia haemolytica]KYL24320.1 translation initiation factor IF-3 [Mannheimia haemolytica]